MSRLTLEEKRLRRLAQRAVVKAVKAGELVRARICSRCGRPDKYTPGYTFAHHHHGYEPEHWLDVVWLCWSCHNGAHGRSTMATLAAPP